MASRRGWLLQSAGPCHLLLKYGRKDVPATGHRLPHAVWLQEVFHGYTLCHLQLCHQVIGRIHRRGLLSPIENYWSAKKRTAPWVGNTSVFSMIPSDKKSVSEDILKRQATDGSNLFQWGDVEFLLVAKDEVTVGLTSHLLLFEAYDILQCQVLHVAVYLRVQIVVKTQLLHWKIDNYRVHSSSACAAMLTVWWRRPWQSGRLPPTAEWYRESDQNLMNQ